MAIDTHTDNPTAINADTPVDTLAQSQKQVTQRGDDRFSASREECALTVQAGEHEMDVISLSELPHYCNSKSSHNGSDIDTKQIIFNAGDKDKPSSANTISNELVADRECSKQQEAFSDGAEKKSLTSEDSAIYEVKELNEKRVGGLELESTIVINTNMGKTIILGRMTDSYAKSIIGLHQFHIKIKSTFYAAKADNPYADLMLLRVEDDFHDSLAEYQKVISDLKNKIKAREVETDAFGVASVEEFSTPKTKQASIRYKCTQDSLAIKINYKLQYGHIVAFLISNYDHIATLLLIAKAYGIITSKEFYRELQIQGKPIRRIYRYGQFWKNHKITRQDVYNSSKGYLEAQNYFMKTYNIELTYDVLTKERLPLWGPNA